MRQPNSLPSGTFEKMSFQSVRHNEGTGENDLAARIEVTAGAPLAAKSLTVELTAIQPLSTTSTIPVESRETK